MKRLSRIKEKLPEVLKKKIRRSLGKLRSVGKPKIFCIGRNKTGTTSVKQALKDWGYLIGPQGEAEQLLGYYKERDFNAIAKYCKPYEAFQDVPFSWPFTFIAMDQFFPGSKFILTIRDNPEQWYSSIVKYHGKMFADGEIPEAQDLKKATYQEKGWMWVVNQVVYNTPESEPYKKDDMINNYTLHNSIVKEYFRTRRKDLCILNPAHQNSYKRLAQFLNKKRLYESMPWKNKTEKV